MTLRHFEKNRLVEYESAQSGMPDARHERHFVPAIGGFLHGLVVEYEPRTGLSRALRQASPAARCRARTSSGGRVYRRRAPRQAEPDQTSVAPIPSRQERASLARRTLSRLASTSTPLPRLKT